MCTTTPSGSGNNPSSVSQKTLKEVAQSRGIYIGTAVRAYLLNSPDLYYTPTIKKEFNIIVAENEMKFESLQPTANNFYFKDADKIVSFATNNGMQIRGHVLLWHQQSGWIASVTNPTQVSNALSNHIFTVMKRYSNVIKWWDVVNEAIDDNYPTVAYPACLRKSFWWTNLGNSYVEYAFQLARAANPSAKLFYNDYNIEGFSSRKSKNAFLLVSNLKDKNLIDGIGMQMHVSVEYHPLNDNFISNLNQYSSLGLEIHITECDVRILRNQTTYQTQLNLQADIYKKLMANCLSNTNVTAFLTWGFTDKYSWIPDVFPQWGDALLFDKNYNKKKSYYALLEAMEITN